MNETLSTERVPTRDELIEEHAKIQARIAEYDGRRHLSPREHMERKRLQKLKLRLKDRIASFEAAMNAPNT